jgi:hypothetical protein
MLDPRNRMQRFSLGHKGEPQMFEIWSAFEIAKQRHHEDVKKAELRRLRKGEGMHTASRQPLRPTQQMRRSIPLLDGQF